MAYNSNTKEITAPVSIYDVRQALGSQSTDLKTLCRSSSIKMYSKYKPTNFDGIGWGLNDDNMEIYFRGAPQNGLYIGCGFNVPAFTLAKDTVVTTGDGSTPTLEEYLEGNVHQQYAILENVDAGACTATATRALPSIGRLTDFYRYTHSSPHYPYSGSTPFRVSCGLPQSEGKNVIDANALIFYQYDNIKGVDGAWLGVKDLLSLETDLSFKQYAGASMTINGMTGHKFFGIMVWCQRSNKALISQNAVTTIAANSDSVTGLTYARSIAIPTAGVVDQNGSKGFKFGDPVFLIPFLLAKNTESPMKYVFHSMNIGGTFSQSVNLLGASAPPKVATIHVNSISGTITYSKVDGEARTFQVYFDNNDALRFNCSGYNASNTMNRLYFYISSIYITPGDGTGEMLDQIGVTAGHTLDDQSGYRYSDFSSNRGNGYNLTQTGIGYNYLRSKIRFSGNGSSAIVGIMVGVYHNNGSGTMVRKYFNLNFTINPSNSGTNTVTATST